MEGKKRDADRDNAMKNLWSRLKRERGEIERELGRIERVLGEIGRHRKKIGEIERGKIKKQKREHIEEIGSWLREKGGRRDDAVKNVRRTSTMIFYLTYLLLASAELTMLYDVERGIILHSVILIGLAIGSTVLYKRRAGLPREASVRYVNVSNLLRALMLLPLIRIFGFTVPLMFFRRIYWFLIISIPLLIAVVVLSRNLKLGMKEVGLVSGRWGIQILVILCGIILGFTEYQILRPKPLIDSLSPGEVLVPGIVLIIFTGFTEELIFRGIIQTISVRVFGVVNGIVYTSVIFTTMHIGFNSVPHMIFVLLTAVFYGYIFQRTGTLTGVILSHGLSNVVLFLIAPFVV